MFLDLQTISEQFAWDPLAAMLKFGIIAFIIAAAFFQSKGFLLWAGLVSVLYLFHVNFPQLFALSVLGSLFVWLIVWMYKP